MLEQRAPALSFRRRTRRRNLQHEARWIADSFVFGVDMTKTVERPDVSNVNQRQRIGTASRTR